MLRCQSRFTFASAALALAITGTAAAQPVSALAPSPAVRCLTPTAQERPLVYPSEAFERKDKGTVHVELTFNAPDAGPSVKWLNTDHIMESLTDAVKQHVRAFRVPCMRKGGSPVVLRQEYVFIPNDGRKVVASTPVDKGDAGREDAFKCMRHLEGEKAPSYPTRAREQEIEGNVFVELRFKSPDSPPDLHWMAPGHRMLKSEVERHAADLRLSCMGDEPIDIDVLYLFRLDGGKRTVLQDTTLPKLIGAAKSYPTPVYFDLTTLGCPFDVRFTYMQPHRPNRIGQLETADPKRQPFLDWLSGLQLRLPDATNTSVLGDTMTVHVPCLKLDL